MAVTARRKSAKIAAVVAFAFGSATLLVADTAADVRAQIGYVASALTSGNAADAMSTFDKSFAGYHKLKTYFQGLNDLQIENEIDVLDEQYTNSTAELNINWTLTLTNPATNSSVRRSEDVHLRLVLKDGKWKIVELSPIELFDPQPRKSSGKTP